LAQLENRGGREKQSMPLSIDLKDAKKVEIRDAAGEFVMSGKFEPTAANLTGAGSARGSASIQIEGSGESSKQTLEASVEGLPGTSSFKLVVDGNEIATFSTDRTGKRVLKLTRGKE
jgi:hypothetical protein